jgi:uncharacterized membrane protein YdjX (TVP38/TMEM64 family)
MVELTDAVSSLFDWTREAGWLGAGVFALVFIVATLAFVPASPLTTIAGFLYGPVWGTLLVSPVGVVAAALAFGFGRSVARPWVRRRLQHHPRLAAIDSAVGHRGFRIVFLLRLASIVPFAPLSYVLGASRIAGRDFGLASWLGLLPGTFLYVYLGSLVSSVGQILRGETPETEANHGKARNKR